MRYSLILFLILYLTHSGLAFPYKVKWHKQSEINFYYYSENALKDLRFFIQNKLKSKKIGITRFQKKEIEGIKFKDGNAKKCPKKNGDLFDKSLIDLTNLKNSKEIPYNESLRKIIMSQKSIKGFAEIQLINGKENCIYYISENFKYIKLKINFIIDAIVKLIDKNGKVIFFDEINPGYTLIKYFEIDKEDSIGIDCIELVLIEKEGEAVYNNSEYISWSVWDKEN